MRDLTFITIDNESPDEAVCRIIGEQSKNANRRLYGREGCAYGSERQRRLFHARRPFHS